MTAEPSITLVRWALNTEHRKASDRAYPLTGDGDYAAWLDRLSSRIVQDRAEAAKVKRRPTDWKPKPVIR